jgi:hypothetical protein
MSIPPPNPIPQFPLVIGEERLLNAFSRVPKHDDLWMVYFNINDSKFSRMLATFCRLVAERLENNTSKYIILAPETATISMAHVLRLQYGFDVQLIGKKQRPNAKPGSLSDTYNPITGGTPQTIYFNGFDEGIDLTYPRQVASLKPRSPHSSQTQFLYTMQPTARTSVSAYRQCGNNWRDVQVGVQAHARPLAIPHDQGGHRHVDGGPRRRF